MKNALRAAALLGMASIAVACSSSGTTQEPTTTPSLPSSTMAMTPTALPQITVAAPAPLPAPSDTPDASGNCAQPPDGVQRLIDGSFTGGEHLKDVFAVTGPDNLIYVGGNIMGADGTKESSADVWLVKDEAVYVVYALSSDARRRTTWPDGRDLASAGDQYGSEVQDCVTTTERARNTGGAG